MQSTAYADASREPGILRHVDGMRHETCLSSCACRPVCPSNACLSLYTQPHENNEEGFQHDLGKYAVLLKYVRLGAVRLKVSTSGYKLVRLNEFPVSTTNNGLVLRRTPASLNVHIVSPKAGRRYCGEGSSTCLRPVASLCART